MDPVSALGLATACAALLRHVVEAQSGLTSIRGKFNTSQLIISSLIAQLSVLEASITELETLLRSQSFGHCLAEALHQALRDCDGVIQYLVNQVPYARPSLESGSGLSRWTRAKFVLSMSGLAPVKEALRDQIQALQLLLSVISLKHPHDQQETILTDLDSARTLTKAHETSSSLLWLRDADSTASILTSETDTLSRISLLFGFDGELLNSRPYRATITTTWRALRNRRSVPQTSQARVKEQLMVALANERNFEMMWPALHS